MKTVVIYQSSTGFTRQYAQWIASELGCEAVDRKKMDRKNIASYDCVVYGGWLMANTITGLDKVRKSASGQLVIFAVGVTPDTAAFRETVKELNHLEGLPFFYMEGGIRYDRLNFFKQFMLKAVKKSLAKKPDKTEQEIQMEKALGVNFDHSDRRYITELVEWVRGLQPSV